MGAIGETNSVCGDAYCKLSFKLTIDWELICLNIFLETPEVWSGRQMMVSSML